MKNLKDYKGHFLLLIVTLMLGGLYSLLVSNSSVRVHFVCSLGYWVILSLFGLLFAPKNEKLFGTYSVIIWSLSVVIQSVFILGWEYVLYDGLHFIPTVGIISIIIFYWPLVYFFIWVRHRTQNESIEQKN